MLKLQIRNDQNQPAILYLANKEPLLLQGEEKKITALFQAIAQGKDCTYWQEGVRLDADKVTQKTAYIEAEAVLPLHQKLGNFLSGWLTKEEIPEFLASLHIQCNLETRIKQLSNYEQTLLHIKLQLLKQPKLILLAYDASSLLKSHIQGIRKLLEDYRQKGCYILMMEKAGSLLPHEKVNIELLPNTCITNYLEESLDFTVPCERSQRKKHRHNLDRYHITSFLGRGLYCLIAFCFSFLMVIHVTVFQTQISGYEHKLTTMEEEGDYPVFLGKVYDEHEEYQSYEMYPYNEEETRQLEEAAKHLPLYPQYSGRIDAEKVADITLHMDGKSYTPQQDVNHQAYCTLASYHPQTKQYLLDRNEIAQDEQTIYMTKMVADWFFPDQRIEDATISMTISFPVYSFRYGEAVRNDGIPIYDYLSKHFEVEAPVKIITENQTRGEFILPVSLFEKAYESIDRSLPYDRDTFFDERASRDSMMFGKTEYILDSIEEVKPFHPNQYLYIADALPSIDASKKALKDIANSSGFIPLYEQTQEVLQNYQEGRAHIHNATMPILFAMFIVLFVGSVLLSFLKQKSFRQDKKLTLNQKAKRYAFYTMGWIVIAVAIFALLHQEQAAALVTSFISQLLEPSATATYDTSFYYQFMEIVFLIFFQTHVTLSSFVILSLGVVLCILLYLLPEHILFHLKRHR